MATVNYTPDPNNKSQLTKEQEAKLAAQTDETIDYSDIPELDADFWDNAQPVIPDLTEPITLRVKRSVLKHFQADGKKGYQSRINAVLESYVQARQKADIEQA